MRITIDVPDANSLDNRHFVASVLAAVLSDLDQIQPQGIAVYNRPGSFVQGGVRIQYMVAPTIEQDCPTQPCIHKLMLDSASAMQAHHMHMVLQYLDDLMVKSHSPLTQHEAMQAMYIELQAVMAKGLLDLRVPMCSDADFGNKWSK